MLGRGTSKVQKAGSEMITALDPVEKVVEDCYEKWSEKNAGMSVHRHWHLFDQVVALGIPALRVIFTMCRGDHHWLFGVVNQIIAKEGLPPIVIPEEIRGCLGPITDLYIKWADEHFPPTAAELQQSCMIATRKAEERMWNVVAPDCRGNYGGTYFSGSLKSAKAYYVRAAKLRARATAMILAEKDDWNKDDLKF